MPRFAKRPINSIKHILDSEGALSGGATGTVPIAVAVPNVDTAVFKPGDIRVGSSINAFFLSIFVIGSSGAGLTGSINWYLVKSHTGQSGSLPAGGATGVSQIRNQIIHEEKGLAGSADGTPMAFKGVVMVPKGMRRMREGDEWFIRINSNDSVNDAFNCVKAIYKSYF